jgi:hypothetical protein
VTRCECFGHQAAHRRPSRRVGRRKCISVPARHRPPRHKVRRRPADKNTLTGRATRALGWSFGSTLLTKVSLFGIGILLARLLGPHAFGTYAVAYVALAALLTFNELGARVDGIYGAGLAEFAVAVLCVLPWYLAGLSNAGIRLRALSMHLRLPLAGAAVVGLLALGAAKVAHNAFTALVASGVATVIVVGLLSYRMRAAVALLQASSAEPVVEQSTSTVTAASAADARSPAGEIAEAPSAIRGEIDAPIRYRDLPHRLGAYQVASDTQPA